jgi:hypothetical protein
MHCSPSFGASPKKSRMSTLGFPKCVFNPLAFDGRISRDANIYCDNFSSRRGGGLFFLSHGHTGTTHKFEFKISSRNFQALLRVMFIPVSYVNMADHMKGLSEHWVGGPIYCSQITRDLVLLRYPLLAAHLNVLQLDTVWTLQDPSGQCNVSVTTFDAGHCAGSCMFLFEFLDNSVGHSVLYTGDLRFNSEFVSEWKHRLPENFVLDHVVLDATFGLAGYDFLTQEASAALLVCIFIFLQSKCLFFTIFLLLLFLNL